MTVRWKPLMLLSGLFAAIGILGVLAIGRALMNNRATDLLPLARAERAGKQYARAEIQYRKAIQNDPKNPRLHLELAGLYDEWIDSNPGDRVAKFRQLRLHALGEAAKLDKQMAEPRRLLLLDALRRNEGGESVRRAKDLSAIDPNDLDAHYVLAESALAAVPSDVVAAGKHRKKLEEGKAPAVRVAWIKARLAQVAGDETALDALLLSARDLKLADRRNATGVRGVEDTVDRLALLKLRVLEATRAKRPSAAIALAKEIETLADRLAQPKDAPAALVTQVGRLLEETRKSIAKFDSRKRTDSAAKPLVAGAVDSIEREIEETYRKTLEGSKNPDPRVVLAFAENLLRRRKFARCEELVSTALKAPWAVNPVNAEDTMMLRELAVHAVLADVADRKRFEKASVYIKEMISSPSRRVQGIGRLFQGAIELERSGLIGGEGNLSKVDAEKLRQGALRDLRAAAEALPDAATAQALYGVALILADEPLLGRQYLEKARALPNLEPRYQVWVAASQIQAGYPEQAAPIIAELLSKIDAGEVSTELRGELDLLSGEIAQGKGDRAAAEAWYRKAQADGLDAATIQTRLLRLSAVAGTQDDAIRQADSLGDDRRIGPVAERLAILTLASRNKDAAARARLEQARKRFPDSDELVDAEVALLLKADHSQAAEKVVAEALRRRSDDLALIQLRARLLDERLDRADDARKLLLSAADRLENSAPLILLAELQLARSDLDAAAKTIAAIRARWKETAAADVLDARLALARGDEVAAARGFEAAARKDPSDKLIRFHKAKLVERAGGVAQAARVYEELERSDATKQVEPGLPLNVAAAVARADLDLAAREGDAGLARYRTALESLTGAPARAVRWKIVAALAAKGRQDAAKAEIGQLLKNEKEVADDELVQAANYALTFKSPDAADILLDRVLKRRPDHARAAVTKAFSLAEAGKNREAAAVLRRALDAAKSPQPAVVYLTLSALAHGKQTTPEALDRSLRVLDEGLKVHPASTDLIRAKYQILTFREGPKAAIAYLESLAEKSDPNGETHRLLVDAYRERNDIPAAERAARELLRIRPDDIASRAILARLIASEGVEAGTRGDRAKERELLDQASASIRADRAKYPDDPRLLEVDFELALLRGDRAKAATLIEEIDALDPASTLAPLLRARLNDGRDPNAVARAYEEALRREPRRDDIRIALAQADLALDKIDEAVALADEILTRDPLQTSAILVKARALSRDPDRRRLAADLLRAALQSRADFLEAGHLLAEIEHAQKRRDDALKTLRNLLQTHPDDPVALALLVEYLCEPVGDPPKPVEADLAEAKSIADSKAASDKRGEIRMALSIGFQRGKQPKLAEPLARRSAEQLDTPAARLNFGDLLLARGETENETDPARAKPIFEEAVKQYDLVLKKDANSIAAVNNKAWILHQYLHEDKKALQALETLARRVDPSLLPAEVLDTWGSIQESLGQNDPAEQTYRRGLRKDPAHAMLNYHLGRLLARDRRRAGQAADSLKKAKTLADRLSPAVVSDLDRLLEQTAR